MSDAPNKAEVSPQPLDDPLFLEACDIVRKNGKANISLLQRHLKLGYARALNLYQLLIGHQVLIGDPDKENYRLANPDRIHLTKLG